MEVDTIITYKKKLFLYGHLEECQTLGKKDKNTRKKFTIWKTK